MGQHIFMARREPADSAENALIGKEHPGVIGCAEFQSP